jgi:hypothetical protein
VTRIITLLIGVLLTYIITYGHIGYTELKNTVNTQHNKEKVMHIETPTTMNLKTKINDTDDSIASLKKALEHRNESFERTKEAIRAGADAYKKKADKYQNIVDIATKKKHKYVSVLGKKKTAAQVQSWANKNMERYREEIAKINSLKEPTSPKIEALKRKKETLSNQLEAEYNKEKLSLDDESLEKGDMNLYLQLLISFLAKMDLYGYFVLRHNIKNRVLDVMHKIIDEFNVVHQLSGILDQFSQQTGQVMKMIGLTGITIQNELAGINHTIVNNGNRILRSNIGLRQMLIAAPTDVELPVNDSEMKAGYQPIGDERVDIKKDRPNINTREERELILTQYVQKMGYPITVYLDENTEIGRIVGEKIYLNPNLSDEDTIVALRHELSHFETKTQNHDKNYKKGIEQVMEKEKQTDFRYTPVKKKNYLFSSSRSVNILSAYSLNKTLEFSNEEINYFKEHDAWNGTQPKPKDYIHLLELVGK